MNKNFRYQVYGRRRNQKGASQIAEFVPALYILFLIVFLPLINLGSVFVGAATLYLATNDFVSRASTQSDYSSALNTMVGEAARFQAFGLAKFISMVPQGGYVACGDDLYIVATNSQNGTVTSSLPDQPLTVPIDTKNNMYELSVKSTYSISPLINLSAVPIIGEVPGVGQPLTLNFCANRPSEHPGGLQVATAGDGGSSGTMPIFNRISINGGVSIPSAGPGTWRDPAIFQQIQAAGQTVVSVNVVLVEANNSQWTPAGVSLGPGQKMWLDTQAVGQWVFGSPSLYKYTDANGNTGDFMAGSVAPNLNSGSLLGAFRPGGTPFEVGDELVNYSPSGSGSFSLIMNDGSGAYGDNVGAQLVRIIVTQ